MKNKLSSQGDGPQAFFKLNEDAQGCIEIVDNIVNTTIVSHDDNVLKAEYQAGFIQGRLQKEAIYSARDNTWDGVYLTDPDHRFPKQLPPSPKEMEIAGKALIENYTYTVTYVKNEGRSLLGNRMSRLLFRMLGIYHGIISSQPLSLDFSGNWLPDTSYFREEELKLYYESEILSFLDIYWLNTVIDVLDVVASLINTPRKNVPTHCSAFVKKLDDEIIIAHNSWVWYLAQTQALNIFVNNDFFTVNAFVPGTIGSFTDFGYNNKGIMFNETTHNATYTEPKADKLWMYMRAALAETFAESINEFFGLISLEPSGTYMNGYMVVDSKTNQIGLIEMSYRAFVYFQPIDGGDYNVTTKPEGLSKEYDREMVTPEYFLGVNYPASQQIRDDLKAIDNRPARKRQFVEMIGGVQSIEHAKALITFTDPKNPLSIYGRWDLGYGETPTPKTVPDGSVDAKAATASMANKTIDLQGLLDPNAGNQSFWMKFGTKKIAKPRREG